MNKKKFFGRGIVDPPAMMQMGVGVYPSTFTQTAWQCSSG